MQPAVVLDFSDYAQRPGNDFGVRGIQGFWIDLHRSYGLYFFVAETLEFSRWLSASFEGGIGFAAGIPSFADFSTVAASYATARAIPGRRPRACRALRAA